ncbi:MAG: SDR family NAD(P)-dependent oxidoreductase [Thermoanaerobaculia bacterium]
MDWNENVTLVTGGSSGIGAALVREISRRGARVIAAARRLDRLETLAGELSGSKGRVIPVACDVTRREDLDGAVALALKEFGRLDTVIANAGFGVVGKFQDLSVDDYRRQFETNVFGVIQTAYAGLEALTKSRGRLALIGSVAGYVPTPGSSPYSMSKFAVRSLAGSLRSELAGEGISVTHIAPGFIESEIYQVDNAGLLHPDWRSPVPEWLRMDTSRAARQIASAVLARRRELVVTGHGKAIVFLERHVPWVLRAVFSIAPEERRKARAPSR